MSAVTHVSVVMPSYNQARFIREAIDSVLNQSYSPITLLVMDGGSTDGTVDILRSYGDRLCFVSQKDRGQSDAINQGLHRADGDIICWLNSDDLFTHHAIQRVVDAFEAHPDVSFVYGKGWNTDERGGIISDSGVLPFDLWKLIHQRNFIQQPSCFFRKSLLEKVGLVNEQLHYVMDWDLWIRFSTYKGLYIDEYLSHNRTYSDNKTQSGQFRRWREIQGMVRLYTDALWPPVLTLYWIEALIQVLRARSWSRKFERPLSKIFVRGMMKEMSGRYPDGGVEPHFQFSVGNPERRSNVKLVVTPLSKYDLSRRDHAPILIRWKSSTGDNGSFSLLENGKIQEFSLPITSSIEHPFVHFCCQADNYGQSIDEGNGLPRRRVVGFLDDILL